MSKEHLTKEASRSAFWNLFGSVAVSAIRFVSTAILARILMPEDFGLIGMATLVTGVVMLFGNYILTMDLIKIMLIYIFMMVKV